MRVVDVREHTITVSRYADPAIPSGGLTTSLVAVTTNVLRGGRPVVGYGFASVGRFGQGGLIRERFAPRLIAAETLAGDPDGDLDPMRAWSAMMRGEKPGGHGERCVAVGTLDMAIWDAAAKIADQPLHRYLSARLGRAPHPSRVRVYAGGGYQYPHNDLARLSDEIRQFRDLGFMHAKIKIGNANLAHDLRRIEAAAAQLASPSFLAVDAMNSYGSEGAIQAAQALAPLDLWWFEDVCDPLDFETLSHVSSTYPGPIAAGEALFSKAEARLLDTYGGLRGERDILLFDPVHCYGLTHYIDIVADLTGRGWPRSAFWPHGGHLFGLHVAAALGLGGAEINPFAFKPFRGTSPGMGIVDGLVGLPEAAGIGFEMHAEAWQEFQHVREDA
ncbi:enolase C-terminal domain-like protein [Sphingomonas morindae]|uniref:Mandelate racemase/muconate lactonizing enzyme C-terminal domain-containing protein n=1 Tax=Sphingomonas morindae TaxID=1541170 RepID=A0ABY4X3T5_9SPHN|nr:enolase C-terminal domain-like protein [Sphingomonas morindae]USI71556.1 hypothetical protein LHA26_09410 [Sphingomonas morindae]